MYISILLILIFLIIDLFVNSGILLWLKKVFKFKNPTYRNAIIIVIALDVTSFTVGIFSEILGITIAFLVFHYFLKKYYQNNWKKSLRIFISFSIISFILTSIAVIPIRLYIAEPFFISGKAMNPTYDDGDYLLINKFSDKFDRRDVIILRDPKEQNQFLIKRIIGLPNEKVEIKNGDILIDGKILNEEYITEKTDGNINIVLNDNQYFVLGDNRGKNSDSRSFGPISVDDIEGKVFYKVFNYSNITKNYDKKLNPKN
ncbi:MAG: signal peptidase I [Candidatus Pacebacteria bacterium]|nr:signal peptidase I [Candidatus Paceibacterota bacterium]